MRIKGLSKNDINYLGKWYAYQKGICEITEREVPVGSYESGYTGNTVRISRKPKNNIYTKALGYLHFQKMLRECHDFDSVIKLEKTDRINTWTTVDKEGRQVLVSFFHGDLIDLPPIMDVLDGEKTDSLFYYFDHSDKSTHEMNETERETYNKFIKNQTMCL